MWWCTATVIRSGGTEASIAWSCVSSRSCAAVSVSQPSESRCRAVTELVTLSEKSPCTTGPATGEREDREGQRQDERFPRDPNPLWYRDATHGQFADALGSFNPATGGAVRIAHLDTGYDPTHKNRPAHIRHDLERNFVDPAHPNDAADRTDALLANSGHGTRTLGILAGQGIGAAPFAEVVPIRVADRVVLF